MKHRTDRRDFLKTSAVISAAILLPQAFRPKRALPRMKPSFLGASAWMARETVTLETLAGWDKWSPAAMSTTSS